MNQLISKSSIKDIQKSLISGETSIEEIVERYNSQINQINPTLNAFISILSPQVEKVEMGKPLAGIPIALKDLFETKAIPTTAGANFLRNYVPDDDAVVVKKVKEAGAILLGKTNMHEIALGVTNINQNYGICRNPWDIERIAGGSSGGSAVAVAAGMCVAALGTDTGGSIRIPASLCGTVGLKPTYGRVSLRGVIPLSWNLDHAGPITNNVRDAAIILQIIAGYDPDDPACSDLPVDDYLFGLENDIKGWKLAVASGEYIEESQPEVLACLQNSVHVFENMGARVDKVVLPWMREAALSNGIMTQSDAATYHHARLIARPEDFSEDVRRRLQTGQALNSTEYARARRVQTEIKRKFKLFFDQYDLLLLPSTPTSAPLIEGSDAVEQARMLTRFTAPFNLAGLPAISVPCGFSTSGLPIGLQIVGPDWSEAKVLTAGHAYERSTRWNDRSPILK
jgi:aspartyl-tRNA(Asn)/glutamyl-tRNA(Gln) amidotransferase subunit A